MRSLLIGAGNNHSKRITPEGRSEWGELVTLDISEACHPDIVWDLNNIPWPVSNESMDEIHAYEVLEHLGKQGDYKSFFDTFSEIHRILKFGGVLCATTPGNPAWIWGDPGHTRVISQESLVFLIQAEYESQVGRTPMTDYREYWKGNLVPIWMDMNNGAFSFVLRKQP